MNAQTPTVTAMQVYAGPVLDENGKFSHFALLPCSHCGKTLAGTNSHIRLIKKAAKLGWAHVYWTPEQNAGCSEMSNLCPSCVKKFQA